MLITMLLFPYNSKTRGERHKWISDSDSISKNKTNLTLPNLLIVSKLLVFHDYVIHYFYNSKNKGERQKQTSDSDSTSKNTLNKRKENIFFYMTLNDNNTFIFLWHARLLAGERAPGEMVAGEESRAESAARAAEVRPDGHRAAEGAALPEARGAQEPGHHPQPHTHRPHQQ